MRRQQSVTVWAAQWFSDHSSAWAQQSLPLITVLESYVYNIHDGEMRRIFARNCVGRVDRRTQLVALDARYADGLLDRLSNLGSEVVWARPGPPS